jgi:hypothetical protein
MSGSVLTLPDPGTAQPVDVGTGTATAYVSGVLFVDTTPHGSLANLLETDLLEYLLPANTLAENGRGLRITIMWQTAVSGGTKVVRLYFGATQVGSYGSTGSGVVGQIVAYVFRKGASLQLTWSFITQANGLGTATRESPTSPLDEEVSIRVTGTNGLAVANEIVLHSMIIEAL